MSEINCDCGYNYTQTGCPNCKHVPVDYTKEYEQALANMQREYAKRGKRITELEAKLAKAVKLLKAFDATLDRLGWHVDSIARQDIRTTLAKLKGQDDE